MKKQQLLTIILSCLVLFLIFTNYKKDKQINHLIEVSDTLKSSYDGQLEISRYYKENYDSLSSAMHSRNVTISFSNDGVNWSKIYLENGKRVLVD